jgi:outer membrane protein OmpA-like peptidoglycan-associated protein
MPKMTRIGPVALLGLLCAAGALSGQAATDRWTVSMRAMQNPLPPNQCTAIEVVVQDSDGTAPLRPDGRQVDWQDFDLSFSAQPADAFYWSNDAHRFLCARAPAATSALVVASYPASHLAPHQRVSGVAQQTIEVWQQGPAQAAAAPAATAPSGGYQPAPTPPAHPDGGAAAGQGYGAPAGAAPAGQPQPAGYVPAAGAAGAAPAGQPEQAAYAGGGAPAAGAAGAAPAGQPQPAADAGAGVPAAGAAGSAPAGQPQPAAYPSAAAPAGAVPVPPSAPLQAEPKKEGGFFKKLGKHLKEKAGEVANQTTQNLSNSATQVVDVTAQTGSNLVAGATAEVTSAAQRKVGSVGTSLVPSSLRSGANADNLDLAVKSGQAVLRMVRFVGTTDVLDASSREVITRLAAVLQSNPGNYLIQAHVDPLPNPANPQQLSESRAAAVKGALIRSGVEEIRLKALGYGATSPSPEVPPEGGPPTSARIEIWKMQ